MAAAGSASPQSQHDARPVRPSLSCNRASKKGPPREESFVERSSKGRAGADRGLPGGSRRRQRRRLRQPPVTPPVRYKDGTYLG